MSLVKMYYITNVVYMVVLLFYSIPVPNTDSTYICFVSWLELIHVHQDSIVNFQRWIMMDYFYSLQAYQWFLCVKLLGPCMERYHEYGVSLYSTYKLTRRISRQWRKIGIHVR